MSGREQKQATVSLGYLVNPFSLGLPWVRVTNLLVNKTTPAKVAEALSEALPFMPPLEPPSADSRLVTLRENAISQQSDGELVVVPALEIAIRKKARAKRVVIELTAAIDGPERLDQVAIAVNTLRAEWPKIAQSAVIEWSEHDGQDPAWHAFTTWAHGLRPEPDAVIDAASEQEPTPTEARYPHSLSLEDEQRLKTLWADNSLRKAEIARSLGVGVDRLDQYKDKYQLPDRRRGQKPGQKST